MLTVENQFGVRLPSAIVFNIMKLKRRHIIEKISENHLVENLL